jgi:2-methylisocitrate lyase-like PEP mutase family enzyme
MTELTGKAGAFLALHRPGQPLLQPNAWDIGSARILAAMGFEAIATTSSGFAASLGRADGQVTRGETLDHCRALAVAVDVAIAADFEDGFARQPEGVAESVGLATQTGLAGCSVEDFTRDDASPIYDIELAADRVRAAVEAAHGGAQQQLAITARAENLIHGVDDLADTIARLQAYQGAGADVLFAPGLKTIDDVRAVVSSVDRPVGVLVGPGRPLVEELATAGVARVSVGGSFAFVAYAALVRSAQELKDDGRVTYGDAIASARSAFSNAFTRSSG